MVPRQFWPAMVALFIALSVPTTGSAGHFTAPERLVWWKGNLHTHSFWSDGIGFPEMIAEWYKTNGYHFLAFSEHDVMQEGCKFVDITNADRKAALDGWSCACASRGKRETTNVDRKAVLDEYIKRDGRNRVKQCIDTNSTKVRLKTMKELRKLFQKRKQFLLIPSEEITQDKITSTSEVHINVTNLRKLIKPIKNGTNVLHVMQSNINAVLAQRVCTGQPMFPHLCHPASSGITASDLALSGVRFFEVYNGAVSTSKTAWDAPSQTVATEQMWDSALTFRLTNGNPHPLYGLAVDDAHDYHEVSPTNNNPGRGWVVVRAPWLSASSLVKAMEAGDFYSSTGVRLKALRCSSRSLAIEIDADPGVEYTNKFIGTRRGSAPTNQIGTVLKEVVGRCAEYMFQGDELYVRAVVESTKVKTNVRSCEFERAWVQPVVVKVPGGRNWPLKRGREIKKTRRERSWRR